MHWLDWTIVAAAILIVIIIGMRTQRYMRGVADQIHSATIYVSGVLPDTSLGRRP